MSLTSPRTVLLALVLGAAATSALAADAEHQRNAAGVQAVEDHWSTAFIGGDEAYLGQLLDPAYVSVGHAGTARPKAEIIALAKKYAAGPKQPMGAKPQSHIDVRGDAAVVTHAGAGDTSVDVFYWSGGAWHAWYSQHTPVPAPAATAG